MTDGLTLYLPFPPSVNNLFPSGKTGKRFPSAQYKAWQAHARYALHNQRFAIVPGRVEVHYAFARPDNRRRDVGNYEKAVSDFLVEQGVIEDDSLIQRMRLEWDETKPTWGTKLFITPFA